MQASINALTILIAILALVALVGLIGGILQRQRRGLFFIAAGMFGFMAAMMAIVSYLVLQTLPQ